MATEDGKQETVLDGLMATYRGREQVIYLGLLNEP